MITNPFINSKNRLAVGEDVEVVEVQPTGKHPVEPGGSAEVVAGFVEQVRGPCEVGLKQLIEIPMLYDVMQCNSDSVGAACEFQGFKVLPIFSIRGAIEIPQE